MSNDAYIEVAVPLPLHTTYTYRASSADTRSLQIGMRVLVPFGKRRLSGYIIGFPETAPAQKLKEIYDLLDNEPLFSIDDLAFYRWAASYYCHPLGQTIQTALPAGLSAEYRHV
ncbi:MAG: primosomal protein N', partial [Deltaproteobacteria bacterium]|nr:primosomal protein N' [Deltaproteobacteria bacterium]